MKLFARTIEARQSEGRLPLLRELWNQRKLGCLVLLVLLGACSPKPAPPNVPEANLDPSIANQIRTAREAVLKSPDSGELWGKLGQVFHTGEFYAQAETCYAKAAEINPQSPRWPHLLGLLLLQEQPNAAISNLNRAVSLGNSQSEASRLHLARALIQQGEFPEAERQLQELVRVNANHAGARLELARISLARGQVDPAVSFLEPCLTNYFTARPALNLMAQVRLRQGDQQAATDLSRRAAQMPRPFDWPDPYLREVQNLRADRQKLQDQVNTFLMQQRFKDAEAALEKLFKSYPDDPEGLLLAGRLRFQQNQCGESEAALRRHLQMQPESLNGLMQLSLALLCQQRWADATSVLQKVVSLKADFAQAYHNLGYALGRQGKSEEAIQNYKQALRCSPGDIKAYLAIAEEYYALKNTTEAIRNLNQALELDPANKAARALRERIQQ
jgi:tetratricopeptide (TPR) repeat protein